MEVQPPERVKWIFLIVILKHFWDFVLAFFISSKTVTASPHNSLHTISYLFLNFLNQCPTFHYAGVHFRSVNSFYYRRHKSHMDLKLNVKKKKINPFKISINSCNLNYIFFCKGKYVLQGGTLIFFFFFFKKEPLNYFSAITKIKWQSAIVLRFSGMQKNWFILKVQICCYKKIEKHTNRHDIVTNPLNVPKEGSWTSFCWWKKFCTIFFKYKMIKII